MPLYSEPQANPQIRGGKLIPGRQIPLGRTLARRGEERLDQSPWFFTPGDVDRVLGPEDFRAKLKEIDSRLEVVWHKVNERWVIWFHAPQEVKTPRLKGWKLIFPVQHPDGSYMPLDERTLAKVWDRTGRRYGSGLAYWNRVEAEYWREYDAKEATHKQYVRDVAGDRFDFAQIKISMRGQSSGSKFANHHSGD